MVENETNASFNPGILCLSRGQVLLNFIVAHFWIGPIVTLFWVSTWQLIITVLVFPHDIYTSIWTSFAIAVGVVFIASCAQVYIHRWANACGPVWREVCSHLYNYIVAFASVNQWRCFWHGWDVYTSTTTANGLATFLGAFVVMALLGCSATLMAAPGTTAVDVPHSTFFVIPTYKNTEPGTIKHVLDSLFMASFPPFLVATVWRGFWVVCDRNLSPDDATLSSCYNLITAYGLGTFLIITRVQWIRLCVWAENKHWLGKYLVEDVHMFLQTVTAISHWRGFWTLLLNHVLLDVTWRYWAGHAIAFVLLSLCFCGKSLLTTGCTRDGAHSNGMGIDLDIYAVSKLWMYWKKKKYNVLDDENGPEVTSSSQNPCKDDSYNNGEKNEHTPVIDKFNIKQTSRYDATEN